jgi:hypothetical protein
MTSIKSPIVGLKTKSSALVPNTKPVPPQLQLPSFKQIAKIHKGSNHNQVISYVDGSKGLPSAQLPSLREIAEIQKKNGHIQFLSYVNEAKEMSEEERTLVRQALARLSSAVDCGAKEAGSWTMEKEGYLGYP